MKKTSHARQQGFTLVELIVVIIILGILSAVALPKFMDVTQKAHYSAVEGAAGGLGAGIALFHAQWVANGHTGAEDNVVGFGAGDVDSNANGWPVSTNGNNGNPDPSRCIQIWNGVMQSPPSVATGTGSDYQATVTGGTCRFTYQEDTSRYISYNYTTGVVSKTNAKP